MQPNAIQPQNPDPDQASTPAPAPANPQQFFTPSVSAAQFMPPQQPIAAVTGVEAGVEAQPAGRGKGRTVAKAVAGILVLALVFAGGYGLDGKITSVAHADATKEAQAFVAALNNGNNAGAYAMGSANLRKQQTESQFAAAMGDLSASKPQVNSVSTTFNGNGVATYNLTEEGLPPTSDGSTSGTFTVTLVKAGLTNWKVDNVTVD